MIKVYIAGEIHTNWRDELIDLSISENLDIQFFSPITDHESSDNCGVEILGDEDKNFWERPSHLRGARSHSAHCEAEAHRRPAREALPQCHAQLL